MCVFTRHDDLVLTTQISLDRSREALHLRRARPKRDVVRVASVEQNPSGFLVRIYQIRGDLRLAPSWTCV